ncbi:AAA family ATPase [Methanoculleus sp. FWC-SCC1]|uniref:AAA family ATPase n=1 Tax=Methanoculleus frigidifontis TaxID=2584085 RepID=A0ABT8M6Q2_9EURY|nr:AAA family ATPase [Methanoculleus sp. FWC-SCC1]MDN7023612.1 AAA family ATPase [Methanoculleus sp. FWC-SCC1]
MEPNRPSTTPTLFQDRSVFAADYVPEPAPSRMAMMDQLAFNLRSGMVGATPSHVICSGPPGTGKTACVRALFAEIEEMTDRFIPVYVDCRIDRTLYAIHSRVFARLAGRPPADDMEEWDVTRAVAEMMRERKAVLVVCLDDIACIGSRSEVNLALATLLRMYESYPGTKIGVVAIVNDLRYHLAADVDRSVFSVFHPTEIFFPPLYVKEIRGILRDRVRQGLAPRAVPVKVLEMVVERVREHGDIRVGLDLLQRAATLAEQDGRRRVTAEDVCTACESSVIDPRLRVIRAPA